MAALVSSLVVICSIHGIPTSTFQPQSVHLKAGEPAERESTEEVATGGRFVERAEHDIS